MRSVQLEKIRTPVGRLDFKSSEGLLEVPGGFDSHSLPPAYFGLRPMNG